jgi:hypothetical protein
MKNLFYLLVASLVLFLPGTKILAQSDDDCCEEYFDGGTVVQEDDAWGKEMKLYSDKKAALQSELDLLNKEIEELNAKSLAKDKALAKAEEDYYTLIGAKKSDVDAFRVKFSDCEKMIQNCKNAESAEKIYKNCFNEIEASKIKCLTEFWERYLLMKKKLEECGLAKDKVVEPKSGNYTVVKGDCLWKIAGKKEIYGNSRLWAKIWEANKSGVVSAPPRVSKTIKNPNLIYPGQVLRIPVLSEAEKKMQTNKVNEVKKKRKNKRGSGEKGTDVKKEVKKDTKKSVKKDTKKATKKHK